MLDKANHAFLIEEETPPKKTKRFVMRRRDGTDKAPGLTEVALDIPIPHPSENPFAIARLFFSSRILPSRSLFTGEAAAAWWLFSARDEAEQRKIHEADAWS